MTYKSFDKYNSYAFGGHTGYHQLFNQNIDRWQYLYSSYVGPSLITSNPNNMYSNLDYRRSNYADIRQNLLWRFAGERSEKYNDRLNTSFYERLAGQAIDEFVSNLFEGSQQPDVPLALNDWLDNVDGKNNDWMSFISDVASNALIFGYSHCMADINVDDGLPYLYHVTPMDLADWEIDGRGNFIKVKVIETADTYRQWTNDTVKLYSADDVLISSTPNTFGFIPIQTVYFKRNNTILDPLGIPFIEPLAELNEKHFNYSSWLQDIQKIMVPFLAWPFPEGEGNQSKNQTIQIGTDDIMPVSDGTGAMPAWIQPDAGCAQFLAASLKLIEQAIRRYAGLNVDNVSQMAESAEALKIKQRTFNQLVKRFSQNLQDGYNRIGRMVCKLVAANEDQFEQPAPKLEGEDTAAVIENYNKAKNLGLPESAMILIISDTVKKLFPDIKEKDLKAIEAEYLKEKENARLKQEQFANGNGQEQFISGSQGQPDSNGNVQGQQPGFERR